MLFRSKNSELTKYALKTANLIFSSFIIKDQELGLIRKDANPSMIAALLLDFMNRITLEEYMNTNVDLPSIEEKIGQLIEIFKKGIE